MKSVFMIGMLLTTGSVVAVRGEDPPTPPVAQRAELKTRAEAVVTIDRNMQGREESIAAITNAFRLIQVNLVLVTLTTVQRPTSCASHAQWPTQAHSRLLPPTPSVRA